MQFNNSSLLKRYISNFIVLKKKVMEFKFLQPEEA